jgi:glycosyltransferase involved in cell wall biosynthesis
MPLARKADVIVAVDGETPVLLSGLERMLEWSGPLLHRLIVVADGSPGPELQGLTQVDPRVNLVWYSDRPGYVELYNRGLSRREGDAVLVPADTFVTAGWLSELAAVARSDERTGCASPLSSGNGICSVERTEAGITEHAIDEVTVGTACSGLPQWTTIPRPEVACVYLRTETIDAVGLLDAGFTSVSAAVDDWVLRAQNLGFVAKRANHAYVHGSGSGARGQRESFLLDRDQAVLDKRHPHHEHQISTFGKTLDCHLAEHAVHVQATGKLRVAYDIRHLFRQPDGTRTYAINLAQALADLPEIDLTLLVRSPEQAEGLKGRVVPQEQWRDDVEVIHKPAQIGNRQELSILFGSSAHLVVTYQDLIAYHIPVAFPSDTDYVAYRTTSNLSMQAAQRILAYSKSSAQEIVSAFGIPHEEVVVVPLGVEAQWFARRDSGDDAICWRLKLPRRYFFSLATDYPHKNLQSLLDAYALLRKRHTKEPPPALVLAGYSVGSRARLYDRVESDDLGNGLTFLGPVSADELRVLYQNAEALVYPSLYEGFGLPPLEAMAAGTPVIAMPFSSIPEVGGDAVLYAGGLSPVDLAQAMEHLATDVALKSELRERGVKRAEQFRWEKTALAVVEVYRSAVLRPTERSLHARRMLREGILHWSEPPSMDRSISCDDLSDPSSMPQSNGTHQVLASVIACDDVNDPSSVPQSSGAHQAVPSSIACDDVNDPSSMAQSSGAHQAVPSPISCDDVNDPSSIPQSSGAHQAVPTPISRDDVNDLLSMPQSNGVRNALRALNIAVRTRMGRELSRFKPVTDQKTA